MCLCCPCVQQLYVCLDPDPVRDLLGSKPDDDCKGDIDEPASDLFSDDDESILVRCASERELLPVLLVNIATEDTAGEKLVCQKCDSAFWDSTELEQHVAQCQSGSFICDTCGKELTSLKSLVKHKSLHSGGNEKLRCPECDKVLATRATLREHLRWHEGVPRVSCHVCGKMLASEESMRKHVKAVHDKLKPHACQHCDYR